MKGLRSKGLAIVAALMLLLAAVPTFAQVDDIVRAEVDRTALTTDEVLTLTVTADQSVSDAPQLPPLPDFEMLGESRGTQVVIANGDMRVSTNYTYYLRPLTTGDLTIGPVSMTSGGQTYQTQPLTVAVAQGTGNLQPPGVSPALPGMPNLGGLFQSLPGMTPGQQPPPSGGTIPAPEALSGQEYLVEGFVDNTNPYQGEQVVYTFRFYQGASLLQNPDYQPPAFTGFWHQQVPDQATYVTEVDGRTYYVNEIQTVLFPTVSGEVTIDAAQLIIPGGFFSSGGSLTTEPIQLTVKPLPPNPPAGFLGAVGQFDLSSAVSATESQVNDAVNLQVTLAGQGNVEGVGDVIWNPGPEWRAFDATAETSTSFVDGSLQGTRIYEQVLVPTQPGELLIPAIQFAYFDPELGDYQSIQTEPIAVQVAPAAGGATTPLDQTALAAAAIGSAGLRPLKVASSSQWSTPRPLVDSAGYWLLFVVPLVAMAVFFGWQGLRRQRLATAGVRQQRRAAAGAIRALSNGDGAAPTANPGRVLRDYLSLKLGEPTLGLTQVALRGKLAAAGVDEDLIRQVEVCLQADEALQYAPAAAGNAPVEALAAEVSAVVAALDEVL